MMKDLEDEIDTETTDLETTETPTTKEPADEAETETAYLEKVRRRAYLLWQSDGEPDGRDQDCWFQAEREIAEEDAGPTPSEPRLVP